MGWREDLAAETATVTASAPRGTSWRDALAAETATVEPPVPTLNFYATPEPEPSFSVSRDADAATPGQPKQNWAQRLPVVGGAIGAI